MVFGGHEYVRCGQWSVVCSLESDLRGLTTRSSISKSRVTGVKGHAGEEEEEQETNKVESCAL
jgi:hypothetical protein